MYFNNINLSAFSITNGLFFTLIYYTGNQRDAYLDLPQVIIVTDGNIKSFKQYK